MWADFAVATVSILILAASFWLLPAISHPAVPLGVSVPSEHAGHPAVTVSVSGYRRKVALAAVVAVVVAAGLAMVWPAGAAVAPILLMTVLGALSAITSRRHIIDVKASEKWFQGTAAPPEGGPQLLRAGVPWSWYITSLGVLLAAAGFGAYKYPSLPATIATHFGANGAADSFSTKSVGSAFGPLFIAAGLLVLLTAIAVLVSRTPARPGGSAGPDADRIAIARVNASGTLLAVTTLTVTVMVSMLAVTGWVAVNGTFPVVVPVVFIVVGLGVGGLIAWHRYRLETTGETAGAAFGAADAVGSQTAATDTPGPHPRAARPDDDRLWLGGFIYNNPKDTRVFVPKRMGLGLTINWGTTGGKLLYGLIVLLIIAAPLTSMLSK